MTESSDAKSFRVLPITEEHIESFRAAVDSVARERQFLSLLEAPSLEACTQFVRGNLSHGNPQLVAVADEEVVGWCDIVRDGRLVHAHCGVLGIGVIRPWRGMGVGRSLLTAALSEAWAKGLSRVELRVREDNLVAIALYERLGFRVEGRHPDAILVGDRYAAVLSMGILGGAAAPD
jgi:ribosomal protein S18 acetylase RimI-like enzyme